MIMSNLFAGLFAQGAPGSRTDVAIVAANENETGTEAGRDPTSDKERHEDATEPRANPATFGS